MQTSQYNFIPALLELAQGEGGRMLAVIGDAQGEGEYWVGARYGPVRTLFEAVLRCLLAGPYERIIACTGQGHTPLPAWQINERFRLKDEEMIWLVRGGKPLLTDAPATRERRPWEIDLEELEPDTTAPIDRMLWRSQGSDYWARLEQFIKMSAAEKECAERCVLVVDYAFLLPNAHEAAQHSTPEHPAFWDVSQIATPRLSKIRSGLPTNLTGTSTDLVLLAEDGLARDLLQEPKRDESSIILKVMARHRHANEWDYLKPQLEKRLPQLYLAAQIPEVAARRTTEPLHGPRLIAPEPLRRRPLYDQLRHTMLNRHPSLPKPPLAPDEVALEFWAEIDLTPLRNAFSDEIIGQQQAKETILGLLENQKRNCARLLEHSGKVSKTARDQAFLLPAVGLFGAAGMGKTTFCNVIVDHLFGDQRFGRVIDLSGKNIKVATIGVEPPMEGSQHESDLMSFAKHSGGLGVVCFDEFTRISMYGQHNSLGTELGPVLQLLQERKFEPANPQHRPQGRFYHFANTPFIFSANVSPQGETRLSGFHSVEDLGPQFTTRVTRIVYFTPLSDEDYRVAAHRSLARYARSWASDFKPRALALAQSEVLIEPRLVDVLEARLKSVMSQSGETASIRRLNQLIERLNYEAAFAAAEAEGNDRLRLGVNLIPLEWQT